MVSSRRIRYVQAMDRLSALRPADAREVTEYVRFLRSESIRYRLALRVEQGRRTPERPQP